MQRHMNRCFSYSSSLTNYLSMRNSFFKRIHLSSFSSNTSASNLMDINPSPYSSAEEMEKKYIVQTYSSNGVRTLPGLVLSRGEGQYLYAEDGKKYLDFCSGIAVNSIGHCDAGWAKAVAEQAKTLCHVSNLFHSRPYLDLAKLLIETSSFDKVFFSNSGTEANEGAIKFSRLYGKAISDSKTKLIAFKGGFHGRTMGSLSLTYKPIYREPFSPLVPGVSFAEFNNLQQVEDLFDNDVAAVFVEPIQGEGGITPATQDFLRGLRSLCDEYNALLICDEVQCGLGRTGRLYAHQVYGIKPDMMTLAKPLAGGLPIGAVLMQNKVAEAVKTGSHGTTFGANAVICKAALYSLQKILSPGFLENVRERGKYLSKSLKKLQQEFPDKIKEVRMPLEEEGLFAGVEMNFPVAEIISKASLQGLLMISAGSNVLRLCPPLVITDKDIDFAVGILNKLLKEEKSK